jgi:hypothetical protein
MTEKYAMLTAIFVSFFVFLIFFSVLLSLSLFFSSSASLAFLFFFSFFFWQAFDLGPSGTAIQRFPGLLFSSLLACYILSLTPILEWCLPLYWPLAFLSLSL